jgi:hypothetical protein
MQLFNKKEQIRDFDQTFADYRLFHMTTGPPFSVGTMYTAIEKSLAGNPPRTASFLAA